MAFRSIIVYFQLLKFNSWYCMLWWMSKSIDIAIVLVDLCLIQMIQLTVFFSFLLRNHVQFSYFISGVNQKHYFLVQQSWHGLLYVFDVLACVLLIWCFILIAVWYAYWYPVLLSICFKFDHFHYIQLRSLTDNVDMFKVNYKYCHGIWQCWFALYSC